VDLKLTDVHYIYNKGTVLRSVALSELNFDVRSGTLLSIIGESGSGKTTLLKILSGLTQPTQGKILHAGQSLSDNTSIKQRIGMVFQRPERQFFENTVYDDIAFVQRHLGIREEIIESKIQNVSSHIALDINALKDLPPWRLNEADQRKASLAAILVNSPELLILDEPCIGMDTISVRNFVQFISNWKKKGRTLVIVAHFLSPFLRITDSILVLKKGYQYALGTSLEICKLTQKDDYVSRLMPKSALQILNLQNNELPFSELSLDLKRFVQIDSYN